MQQSELYGNIERENRRIFSVNNIIYKIILIPKNYLTNIVYKDLYYIINHPSPIEELNKILEISSIEGA